METSDLPVGDLFAFPVRFIGRARPYLIFVERRGGENDSGERGVVAVSPICPTFLSIVEFYRSLTSLTSPMARYSRSPLNLQAARGRTSSVTSPPPERRRLERTAEIAAVASLLLYTGINICVEAFDFFHVFSVSDVRLQRIASSAFRRGRNARPYARGGRRERVRKSPGRRNGLIGIEITPVLNSIGR